MESPDNYSYGDSVNKSTKKKHKRKHKEITVSTETPDVASCEDEHVKKKSKKKEKKSEHFCEEIAVVSMNPDKEVSPVIESNEDPPKKKSKKKKDRSEQCDDIVVIQTDVDGKHVEKNSKNIKKKSKHFSEKTAEVSMNPDNTATPVVGEGKHVEKNSKKVKNKSKHFSEKTAEVSMNPDNTATPVIGKEANESAMKKKSNKRKDRSEHNYEEIVVTPLILTDIEDGRPEKKRKKKHVGMEKQPLNEEVNYIPAPGDAEEHVKPINLFEGTSIERKCINFESGNKELNILDLPSEPICPYCQKIFKENEYRNNHVKVIHFKIKRFICNFCSTAFGDKTTLRVHKRLHTNEMNYGCRFCEKVFRNSSNLHNHQRRHLKWAEEQQLDVSAMVNRLNEYPAVTAVRKDKDVEIILDEMLEDEDALIERLVARTRK